MRTLTAPALVEVAKPVTAPGYFVQIGFSVVVRLSTRGTLTWNAVEWTAANMRLSGFGLDGSTAQDGTLTLVDSDGQVITTTLADGYEAREVDIWAFHGSAPAAGDPVQIFSGVIDSILIDTQAGTIAYTLKLAETLYSPRDRITVASGFNFIPPAGTRIEWGNEVFILERER